MSTKKIKTYHGTPLHFAMISNKRKEIIKLIDENIDQVKMKDSNEEYPLVLAVRYDSGYDVVKKLLTIYPDVLKDIIWIDNKTNVMHYIIESCTEHSKLEYYIDLICGQNKELLNLRDHKKKILFNFCVNEVNQVKLLIMRQLKSYYHFLTSIFIIKTMMEIQLCICVIGN